MAALWIILKIIGIILLCIFVFLLLILFAPAGYLARGVYNGWEKWAKARVSWLFFFLRMKVSWKEGEEPAVSLRILGFPVYHSDEERWSLLNRKAADDVVEIRESGKDIRDRAEVPREAAGHPADPDSETGFSGDILDYTGDGQEFDSVIEEPSGSAAAQKKGASEKFLSKML